MKSRSARRYKNGHVWLRSARSISCGPSSIRSCSSTSCCCCMAAAPPDPLHICPPLRCSLSPPACGDPTWGFGCPRLSSRSHAQRSPAAQSSWTRDTKLGRCGEQPSTVKSAISMANPATGNGRAPQSHSIRRSLRLCGRDAGRASRAARTQSPQARSYDVARKAGWGKMDAFPVPMPSRFSFWPMPPVGPVTPRGLHHAGTAAPASPHLQFSGQCRMCPLCLLMP